MFNSFALGYYCGIGVVRVNTELGVTACDIGMLISVNFFVQLS